MEAILRDLAGEQARETMRWLRSLPNPDDPANRLDVGAVRVLEPNSLKPMLAIKIGAALPERPRL